ncbi:MAG: NAD-dependent epimerase/dehydratase family protein [Bacteroidales bacterium]|nr:NAD-dependent epimerase/dehydratase family protein [Bacteroidales bacterium]
MIFVTGGTGLLGGHLLWHLLKEKEQIRAFIRSEKQKINVRNIFSVYTNEPEDYLKEIEWIEGDLLDYNSVEKAVLGSEKVYNTAAVVSYLPKRKAETIKTNILITKNLINACLSNGVERICHVSSIAALGDSEDKIDEETAYDFPVNASGYSLGKYHSELEVWRGFAEGLQGIIVNPSVIIGPGDWNRSSAALFKTVSKGLKFYTSGTTGYVDVRDVATAMIKLMQSEINAERFLLNGENLDYYNFLSQAAKNFDKEPPRYKAGMFASLAAAFVENLKYKITGIEPLITRETAVIANRKNYYNGEKITKFIPFEYTNISESISFTCKGIKKIQNI